MARSTLASSRSSPAANPNPDPDPNLNPNPNPNPDQVSLDGLRRRGFSAAVVNKFCEVIGVTRSKMTARIELLEQIARQELDATAPRRFVVLRPLKVVLTL